MEEIKEEKGLSLSDLFHIIRKHLFAIIVSIVVCTGLGLGYSIFLNPVSYQASSNVYVLYSGNNSNSSSSEAINYGRLGPKTFADALNSDSKIWLKIEKKALANNELLPEDERVEIPSYHVIGKGLKAKYDSDLTSLLFSFSYTSSNKELVAPIMNATLDVLQDITNKSSIAGVEKDAFNYFTLSILGDIVDGDISETSTSKKKIVILALAVGVVIGAAYTLIYELLDQRITNKNTIEEICDLKIIGLVPELADPRSKGGKK